MEEFKSLRVTFDRSEIHDMRSSVAAIIYAADAIRSYKQLGEKEAYFLDILVRNAQALQVILDKDLPPTDLTTKP